MHTSLVVGGAGFIGSHLTDALLREGHRVVALDNLSLGRLSNLEEASRHPQFTFLEGDALDEPFLDRVFAEGKFDTVFHLAANSDISRSIQSPDIDFNTTFRTTYRILEAMRAHGVKRLAFASTSAIYGETKPEPIAESYGPLFPISHYGAAKLASEGFISSFAASYGMQAWLVRFPNVVGERATHGVIFDFIKKLRKNPDELEVLGDGRQQKPYLYVKDLVGAIRYVMAHASDRINVFNAGVEGGTRVSDIARMVIEKMGLQARIRYTGGSCGWVGDVPRIAYYSRWE